MNDAQDGVGGEAESTPQHRWHEDSLAMLVGTLLAALGVTLYSQATLLTGSTAGIAFLLQYASGWPFGAAFFVINLPFYYLAIRRMGWSFTLRTFTAIALLSLFAWLTPRWLDLTAIQPLYAAVAGGALIGVGMLVLFRHRASLGGVNILALYLQDRGLVNAGYFQLGVDALIMLAGCLVVAPERVALSVLGALMLNLVVALNHRPGRYVAVS